MIIDTKDKIAYFKLNPLRYEIIENYVVDKIIDDFAFRNIEYKRFELTNNKILDKITQKEYDNFEDIILLLNSQNQFIDNTKDVLDEEVQLANRNARYASEIGDDEEMNVHLYYKKELKKIQNGLFSNNPD